MDTIISSSRLIAEIGILTVCGGVIVALVYTMFLTFRKQNEKMLSRIMELSSKEENTKEKEMNHCQEVNYRMKIDIEIQTLLDKILKQTGADRIYIVEFHNGEKNLSGLSLSKMTMTFEISQPMIPSRSGEFNSIPLSLIPRLMSALYKDKYAQCISETDSYEEFAGGLISQILKKSDCRSIFIRAITDQHDGLIGFVGISYLGKPIETEKINMVHEKLKSSAYRLSVLLNLVDRSEQL